MEFNFDNERPIYIQLVELIRIKIVSGEFQRGQKTHKRRNEQARRRSGKACADIGTYGTPPGRAFGRTAAARGDRESSRENAGSAAP